MEKKKLNKVIEGEIKQVEEFCEKHNITNIARDIAEGTFVIEEEEYLKVNLPDSIQKWKNGNGEGCWAVPYEVEDKSIMDIKGEKFKVVLCNDCIYYPFPFGTVIEAESRGTEFRPVLNIETVLEYYPDKPTVS